MQGSIGGAISKIRSAVVGGVCLLLSVSQGSHAGTFEVADVTEISTIAAQVRAAQFLTRATFGPTQPEIDQLAAEIEKVGVHAAFEAWIDNQFLLPPSQHRTLAREMIQNDGFALTDKAINPGVYREFAWWHIALTGQDQLRQRLAWALYQIAPVSTDVNGAHRRGLDASGEPSYLGLASYYDTLARNAFSTYRELLLSIALHPVMGTYLGHALNPKGIPEIGQYPDENFAREIMQLFSIGVYELKANGRFRESREGDSAPIETYDNHTIEALARVFTGLYYAGTRGFESKGENFHDPMEMDEAYHDSDSKVILSGVELPANQTGMKDIKDTIDTIARHQNVGPYIGKLLIQKFVKSNPSAGYIISVSSAFYDNGSGVRGDMKAVIKAILLHPEALDSLEIEALLNRPALIVTADKTQHSRLREPILRYSAFLRAFAASSTYQTNVANPNGLLGMSGVMFSSLQSPYRAPSVFGYFDPNYAPTGALQSFETSIGIPNRELSAPEFEIMTSVSILALANLFYRDITQGGHDEFILDVNTHEKFPFRISIDLSKQQEASGVDEMIGQLNILMCRGAMSDATRDVIVTELKKREWKNDIRVRAAVLMIATAPDCAVVQ